MHDLDKTAIEMLRDLLTETFALHSLCDTGDAKASCARSLFQDLLCAEVAQAQPVLYCGGSEKPGPLAVGGVQAIHKASACPMDSPSRSILEKAPSLSLISLRS